MNKQKTPEKKIWGGVETKLSADIKEQFLSFHQRIKTEYNSSKAKSAHLPPQFYLLWEGLLIFWRGHKNIKTMIIVPWLLASVISAVFYIWVPKSLVYNYAVVMTINFLLIMMSIFPISHWAVGNKFFRQKKFSLSPFGWDSDKRGFLIKITLWFMIYFALAIVIATVIGFVFDIIDQYLQNEFLQSTTERLFFAIYFLLMLGLLYGFALWIFYIPYAIFRGQFDFIKIREFYDLEFFENEIKLFFRLIWGHHLWIFTLFLTMLLVPTIISVFGVGIATVIYYGGNAMTFWLPLSIRSSIIQASLMGSVVLLVVFITSAICAIILSRAFYYLCKRKPAPLPALNNSDNDKT